jgi:uncharacterized protein YraI
MRGFTTIAIWLGVLAALAPGADQSFPYFAEISVAEVEVRSGPGWEYYVTQRMKRGSKVQVYRHDPGGWLAIRPPQGSYSWIAARHLNMTDDQGIAEVAVDGVVAWVGSTPVRNGQHKWQVRLKRGELVEVLDSQPLSVGPGFATETYYQVSPPAGEFRWIHAENGTAPQGVKTELDQPTIQLTKFPSRSHVQQLSSENTLPADRVSQARQLIDELNLELSLLVTRKIEQWNLESLRRTVAEMAETVDGTELAKEVRAISQRITEFEGLRKRYQSLASGAASDAVDPLKSHAVVVGPNVAEKQTADEDSASTPPSKVVQMVDDPSNSPFDAQGWLMPVHSSKRIAPPFALLDDEGRVRCYVTPAPGLNLRRYERKNVGLLGQRRYVDALHGYHVTAERVVKQETKR